MARAIPEGYASVTPHLCVPDAAAAIAFYRQAFGATELFRLPGPGGQGVVHAEIKIGDSIVMLADESPHGAAKSPVTLGGFSASLLLYVPDADAAFQQAVAAGAKAVMPVTNMFWGDRYGRLQDPFGHQWALATHVEDVSPEEMARRAADVFSQLGQ